MIKINNVNKEYVVGTKVVNNLNLEIKEGEIFGFLGPNGAGKTTTLKMITGVTSIDSGSIEVNGYDISNDTLNAKKQFGFVPDNPNMFLRLKGLEYLKFMATIYGQNIKDVQNKIEEYAKQFGIYDALNKPISDYSHGMRQKIVLLGALIHDPKVWILDEPLTGLDPQSSHLLKEMMREHAKKGNTVLFSTHVLEVAERIVDRIGIIRKGELIFVGTIDELKEKYNATEDTLEEVFLELTK